MPEWINVVYFRPLKIKVGAKGLGCHVYKIMIKNENQITLISISHFPFV